MAFKTNFVAYRLPIMCCFFYNYCICILCMISLLTYECSYASLSACDDCQQWELFFWPQFSHMALVMPTALCNYLDWVRSTLLCSLICGYQRFSGDCNLHFQEGISDLRCRQWVKVNLALSIVTHHGLKACGEVELQLHAFSVLALDDDE